MSDVLCDDTCKFESECRTRDENMYSSFATCFNECFNAMLVKELLRCLCRFNCFGEVVIGWIKIYDYKIGVCWLIGRSAYPTRNLPAVTCGQARDKAGSLILALEFLETLR